MEKNDDVFLAETNIGLTATRCGNEAEKCALA